jgi:hypothetical protein
MIPEEGVIYRWQAEDLADRADAAEERLRDATHGFTQIEKGRQAELAQARED